MATIMQDETFDLERFTEERLAKALDDLYARGLDTLMSGIALEAIRQYGLDTRFLDFDTTSLSFYGSYEREVGETIRDMHALAIDIASGSPAIHQWLLPVAVWLPFVTLARSTACRAVFVGHFWWMPSHSLSRQGRPSAHPSTCRDTVLLFPEMPTHFLWDSRPGRNLEHIAEHGMTPAPLGRGLPTRHALRPRQGRCDRDVG